jgi:hypothetical protein
VERTGPQWQLAYLETQEFIHTTSTPKADNRSYLAQAYSELSQVLNSGGPPPGEREAPENLLDGDGYLSGWDHSLRPPEVKWL